MMTKEFNFSLEQFTFTFFSVEFLLTKYIAVLYDMLFMFFQCLTEDENIIEEYNDEIIEMITKCLMHQMHECCWCIGETEW